MSSLWAVSRESYVRGELRLASGVRIAVGKLAVIAESAVAAIMMKGHYYVVLLMNSKHKRTVVKEIDELRNL